VDDVQQMASPSKDTSDTVTFTKYDRRSLSYASTFDDPVKSRIISIIELFTGKLAILRMIRKFDL